MTATRVRNYTQSTPIRIPLEIQSRLVAVNFLCADTYANCTPDQKSRVVAEACILIAAINSGGKICTAVERVYHLRSCRTFLAKVAELENKEVMA